MKITLSYEDENYGMPIHRTVIIHEPGPGQLEDIVQILKSFLLVIGYHPNSVNEYFDDEYRKVTDHES